MCLLRQRQHPINKVCNPYSVHKRFAINSKCFQRKIEKSLEKTACHFKTYSKPSLVHFVSGALILWVFPQYGITHRSSLAPMFLLRKPLPKSDHCCWLLYLVLLDCIIFKTKWPNLLYLQHSRDGHIKNFTFFLFSLFFFSIETLTQW